MTSDSTDAQSLVTVATFFSIGQAQAARAALEGAGVEAWLTDEIAAANYPGAVGIRLQVGAADSETALELLEAEPPPGTSMPPELAEPACPSCGSRAVLPEVWGTQEQEESGVPEQAILATPRAWYYVCHQCREAWPV